MKKTKGQLGNLQGIILALVVVGILLGAGFFILDEFLAQTDNVAVTVTNETNGFINETGYTVNGASDAGFNTFSVSVIVNATDGVGTVILPGNYTVNSDGSIVNASTVNYADVNISYTYEKGGSAFAGVQSTITAMLTIPQLLGLIVLIAMIGIILAIIFQVIPGARVSGA